MIDFSKMPTAAERAALAAERAAERAARPLRVVFSGWRDWRHQEPVRVAVRRLAAAGCQRVAHGAARGLDALVDAEARLCEGVHVERYPANWASGRAAGIYRNLDMLRREEPHVVVAFRSARGQHVSRRRPWGPGACTRSPSATSPTPRATTRTRVGSADGRGSEVSKRARPASKHSLSGRM